MKIDIDQLKKKIIYRSTYRGTKEMDKILGSFIKRYINELDVQDLLDLEKLIETDDDNLYNFYNKLNTKIKFIDNKVNLLFKNFKY
tara:strand:+ start:1819 stop:2076 length:258 start_codon:yes stop_codon:yes gene_type:complete